MRGESRRTPGVLNFRALALPVLRLLLGHRRHGLPPRWLTHQLGRLHWLLAWRKRTRLQRDMARALNIGDRRLVSEILRRSWLGSDRAILEVASLYRNPLSPELVRAHCEVEGLDTLRAAHGEGKGVIMLTLHAGNLMLLAARLAQEGLPVSVLYREARKTPDRFFQDCMEPYGIETICVQRRPARHGDLKRIEADRTMFRAQSFLELRRALRRKRILLVMLDASSKGPGIPLPFLGKEMTVSPGPEHLARGLGAHVVPLTLQADAPRWTFRIEQPWQLDFEQSPAAVTATMLTDLERHVLQHPWAWSWHQRRWRRLPFIADGDTGD